MASNYLLIFGEIIAECSGRMTGVIRELAGLKNKLLNLHDITIFKGKEKYHTKY